MKKLLPVIFTILLLLCQSPAAQGATVRKAAVVPLDGRNQTYDYVRRIMEICGYSPLLPPLEMTGNINDYESAFKKQWNIWIWLNHTLDKNCELLIVSSDSLVYGGLLESRHSPITTEKALNNAALLKPIRSRFPHLKILVFSSIPRKEAEYRERNFLVNMKLLDYARSGIIDFLSISGDDATDISRQVKEIAALRRSSADRSLAGRVLISDVDRIRLGVDDSAMVLFMRYLNEKRRSRFRVYIEYQNISYARLKVDHYSATPVMSVAIDMVEATGSQVVYAPEEADLVLAVSHPCDSDTDNNFLDRIGHLMTLKPVTLGDVSNREEKADLFRELYRRGLFGGLAGYAGWGMGTNSLGTAFCEGMAFLYCRDSNSFSAHLAFLYERMIADYIYLDLIHLSLPDKTGIPAYNLEIMTPEQESLALSCTYEGIEKALSDLGISHTVQKISPGGNALQAPAGFTYIPLDHQADSPVEENQPLITFTVKLSENRYAKEARITCGPIFFPFHRLFEIWIPTRAVLDGEKSQGLRDRGALPVSDTGTM